MAELPIIEGLFDDIDDIKEDTVFKEPEIKPELPIIEGLFEEIDLSELKEPETTEIDFSQAWDNIVQGLEKISQTIEPVTEPLKRFGSSFSQNSSLMQTMNALQFKILEKGFGSNLEGLKESNPELYEAIKNKDKILEGEDAPSTGVDLIDKSIDVIGSVAGTIFDYATLGRLLSPVFSSTLLGNLPLQSGLRLGATSLARTGLEDIAGGEVETKDYLKSGLSGFVAGEAGKGLENITRNISTNFRLSETVYPWIQQLVSGAGTGAALTGVDFLFEPEDTTVADLGVNMASMALLYSLPLVKAENREAINKARMNLIHSKALDKNARMDAFRMLGLSENATRQDIKNRWKEISREFTKGRAASIPEEEKLQILADVKRATDEALRAIENMPLSTKVKNIVIQKLNELTTGISRKFTGLRPAKNLPVEQRFTKEPLTSVESFIKRIETIKPEQAPEQITAQEIAGLLMEPAKDTTPIQLPGEVAPGEPILMPGEVIEPEAIKDYKGILATTEKGEIYKLTFDDYIWAQKQDAARKARKSPVSEAEKERREERALKSFEDESYIKKFRDIHKEAVKKALEKGYTVPQEVLNEYPELQNQTVIRADERKDPLEMTKDEFVKEYMKIVEKVRRAEKDEEIEPIPENIGTVNHSNWEEWSRKRGYTEQEIEDFKYMLKFFGEGLFPDINERLWSAVDEGYLDFIDTEWGTKEYDPEMLYDVLQEIREAKFYKDTEGEFSFPVEGEAEEPQIEAPGAPRNKVKTGDRVRWTTEPVGGKTETFEGTVEQIQPTDAGNRVIIRTDDGKTVKGFDYKGKLELLSEEPVDREGKTNLEVEYNSNLEEKIAGKNAVQLANELEYEELDELEEYITKRLETDLSLEDYELYERKLNEIKRARDIKEYRDLKTEENLNKYKEESKRIENLLKEIKKEGHEIDISDIGVDSSIHNRYLYHQDAEAAKIIADKLSEIYSSILSTKQVDRKPQKPKEPWEMSYEEFKKYYIEKYPDLKDLDEKRFIKSSYKQELLQAAYEGKEIPEEVLKEDKALKNVIGYIQAEMKADDTIDAAAYRMLELENKEKPVSRDELEYRLLQIRAGIANPEEVLKGLNVTKSGVRNELGNYEDRWNMVSDILEEVPSNKNFIEVETPGGKMHVKNDPGIIADLLTELGARDMTRPLKGEKLEIIKPSIDKSQLAKDMYYANIDGKFLPVVGAKPFGVPGTEELDLFRYQTSKQPKDFPDKRKGWLIAEGKTGLIVANGKTIQEAAKNLKKIIDEKGLDTIKEIIEQTVQEKGISPRYGGELSEEGKTKEQAIYEARREIVKRKKRQDPEKVPDTEPVTRQELEEYINLEMKVPFRYGKLHSSRAEGQYDRFAKVIRTRDYSDNEITGHEMGHHISNKLELEVKKFPELKRLLEEEGLAEAYPEQLHYEEGAAEFFKYYFTSPSVAVMKAPGFAAYVENKLQKNPEFNRQVKTLQNLMVRWEQQTSRDRLAGSIAKRPSKQRKLLAFKDKLIDNWVADDINMRRALEEAGVDWEKLEITKNPVKLRRLFASVNDKIDTFLTKRTLDPYGRPYMESLLDILSPVRDYIGEGGEIGNFEVYALAKHALEREARYIANNIDQILLRRVKAAGIVKGQNAGPEELKQEFKNIIDVAIKKDDYDTLANIVKNYGGKIGKATGLRVDDILELIKPYEKEHPEFKETLKKLDKYQNNLVDYLVHRDMLSKEAAKRIKDSYSFHLPLYRLFGAGETYFEGTGGNKYANLPNPLKRAYGSTRIIKDPIRNIIRDTVYVIRQGDKNRIALSLTKAIEGKEGTGWLVEDVPLPKEPHQFALEQVKKELKLAGLEDEDIENLDLEVIATIFETQYYAGLKEHRENVVMIRENGKVRAKELHPELYEFLQDVDVQTATILDKLLKPIEIGANIFKAGAVLDPRFWIRNLGRDEFREVVFGKNGLDILKIGKTVIDGVAGLAGLSKEDTEAIFRGAGGARAGFFNLLNDIENPDTVSKLLKSKDFSWNPLDWLTAASSWTEDIRRRGFFIQGLDGVDLNKLSPEEFEKKALEAGYKARGGILEDYGIKGKYSRAINRYFPFFSAGVTGSRHFFNMLKDPLTWLKGFAFITVPSILLYMRNRDKPEYQELPQWRKVFAFNWITDEGNIISFPKPFLPGIFFGSLPEMVLEYADTKDPDMLNEAWKNAFRFGAPNYEPAHVIPWLEVMFNKRLESGVPIVPESEKYLKPEEQYSKWTSEPAKILGDILNISPRKIDHLLRGQFSSLGSSALEMINFVSGAQDFKEVTLSVLGVYNEPFSSSGSIDKLYKERDKARTIVETFRNQVVQERKTEYTREEIEEAFRKKAMYERATSILSDLRKVENIIDKAKVPDEIKDNALKFINIQQINVARKFLGKPVINIKDYMEPDELRQVRSLIESLGG